MIRGPEKTPYEDGLFFFDFQLSADYPKAPPLCHYVSYCSDRLNPNLYEDGKVSIYSLIISIYSRKWLYYYVRLVFWRDLWGHDIIELSSQKVIFNIQSFISVLAKALIASLIYSLKLKSFYNFKVLVAS